MSMLFSSKVCILTTILLLTGRVLFCQVVWESLESGLSVAEIKSPITSDIGPNIITILKINPAQFEFVMVNASAKDSLKRTVAGWCKENKLLGAVNAGMFDVTNHITNTGYMKNFDHVNNPVLTPNYKLVLAFNPKGNNVPLMQVIDLECEDWNKLKTQYNSYSQGLRVINCRNGVAWGKSLKKWSMVLWGIDKEGNALWIFTRSPLPVDVFAKVLLELNIGIQRVMYLKVDRKGRCF